MSFISWLDKWSRCRMIFFNRTRAKLNRSGGQYQPPDDEHDTQPTADWFESAVQRLVSHGHTRDDVMQMSYGVFLNFYLAVNEQQNQHYRRIAEAVRVGQYADADAWRDYMKMKG